MSQTKVFVVETSGSLSHRGAREECVCIEIRAAVAWQVFFPHDIGILDHIRLVTCQHCQHRGMFLFSNGVDLRF